MVILLVGSPGAGKTFSLKTINEMENTKLSPVKKYTTRCKRNYEESESIDLIYNCDKKFIQEMDYSYTHKKEWYGITKNQLDEIISKEKIPVIIVRDFTTIEKIKNNYSDVKTVWIIGETGDELHKKLEEQGRNNEEIHGINEDFSILADEIINGSLDIDYIIVNILYDKNLLIKQLTNII